MPIVFEVREVVEGDLDDLLRLNQDLFDYEFEQGFSNTYNREWTYSETGKNFFKSFISDQDRNAWVAVNENGEAVAYIACAMHDLAFRSPTKVCEIEMAYVDEGYRCSGIGRTLVDECKKWASEKNAGIIRVGALAKNKHARDFYQKWGFEEAEIMYEMSL